MFSMQSIASCRSYECLDLVQHMSTMSRAPRIVWGRIHLLTIPARYGHPMWEAVLISRWFTSNAPHSTVLAMDIIATDLYIFQNNTNRTSTRTRFKGSRSSATTMIDSPSDIVFIIPVSDLGFFWQGYSNCVQRYFNVTCSCTVSETMKCLLSVISPSFLEVYLDATTDAAAFLNEHELYPSNKVQLQNFPLAENLLSSTAQRWTSALYCLLASPPQHEDPLAIWPVVRILLEVYPTAEPQAIWMHCPFRKAAWDE